MTTCATPAALSRAHTRILGDLAVQLIDADSDTMGRAIRAAEQYLADSGHGDLRTINDAVRAGVAAARCP
jgi:formylmethanofuran dehydrogenase subunit E-like metal-binding protein